MAWSNPSSVTTGDLITSATWNQNVVDNVQYVHDNRAINYVAGAFSSTGLVVNIGRENYGNDSMYFYYRGGDIDEDDLNGAFFWAQIAPNNAAATACAVLWNVEIDASVIGSSASITGTTNVNAGSPAISSDISACLPTGNVSVQTRLRTGATCAIKYQSSGLILVF